MRSKLSLCLLIERSSKVTGSNLSEKLRSALTTCSGVIVTSSVLPSGYTRVIVAINARLHHWLWITFMKWPTWQFVKAGLGQDGKLLDIKRNSRKVNHELFVIAIALSGEIIAGVDDGAVL